MKHIRTKWITTGVIFPLIILFLANIGTAREVNEIPFYGGHLTPEEQKANERFLEEIDRLGKPRSESAKHAVMRGWQYLNARQPLMAIKRFNQAWLLDPNNANVYWGLGAAQSVLGEHQDGINLITRASKLDKNNADIVTDMGRSYLTWGIGTKDNKLRQELFDKAISKYPAALKLNPKSEYAYSNWAIALFYKGKYAEAWRMVKKARELGGKTLDPQFLKDLTAKMSEPK